MTAISIFEEISMLQGKSKFDKFYETEGCLFVMLTLRFGLVLATVTK